MSNGKKLCRKNKKFSGKFDIAGHKKKSRKITAPSLLESGIIFHQNADGIQNLSLMLRRKVFDSLG